MLRLTSVSKSFYVNDVEVQAIKGLNLHIDQPSFVAITGPSGSGKTTLLGLASGLLECDTGKAIVAGGELTSMTAARRGEHRLRHIGLVFQDHRLIPEFSVLENIMLPLVASGAERFMAASMARRALNTVQLSEYENRRPKQLSGGQQQRVGIARAIAGNRKVILCDEPTGSLDSANSSHVFEQLGELADSGRCVLVATHDPLVTRFASVVRHMTDGDLES